MLRAGTSEPKPWVRGVPAYLARTADSLTFIAVLATSVLVPITSEERHALVDPAHVAAPLTLHAAFGSGRRAVIVSPSFFVWLPYENDPWAGAGALTLRDAGV
jgi:hypothetical protein